MASNLKASDQFVKTYGIISWNLEMRRDTDLAEKVMKLVLDV